MPTITMRGSFRPQALAVAVALAWTAQAHAVNFNIGELEGQFDSSLSLGTSWALRNPDPKFISNYNVVGAKGTAASRTADDGRLNFSKGDTFSKIFKGTHDLELKYGDSGAFLRGKYWYDFELKDEDLRYYNIDDRGRDQSAKASGAEFLDAFVYHNYQLGDLPGNVRFGKQVVSWGESTFIPNSINSINPVDVSALRRPGAEVKEALIPVQLFYLSQGLSENVTAEGFYQIKWDKTTTENCGTFFAVDAVAKGCDDRLVIAGPDFAPGDPRANSGNILDVAANRANAYIPRTDDHEPGDSGQFGLALRWFLPELNDTELGAYVMNYHSRNPYLSFTRTTFAGASSALTTASRVRGASYFVDYPEDIHLYGLSFQTNLSGVALSGEVSYRPNMPMQINTADLNLAAVNQVGRVNGVTTAVSPVFLDGQASNTPGAAIQGYKRLPFTQVQVTATQFFDQVLGAERLTLVGEVGYDHISGIDNSLGSLRFGRSPTFGAGELVDQSVCVGTAPGTAGASNPQQECNNKGYYTTSSWGYRVRGILDYPNVIAGINFKPNMAWSQDVNGTGPSFEEGAKAISLGLDADYQNTYTMSLSYTNYFGGDYNTLTDRDYMSVSVGVNF
ncbi:DUF1302 domain-containing protein [Pseudomonas sp. ZM23]|uniref:DUF1302 domain-containing protein n=1 Tax=Pseudomonas triclosanedens TaxID=2961893 RepID=A0ABY6ZQR7_9PSED|nr:DUF1302 domain-containing protein [Pseudomonas triclosanedens]MCP8467615.1 DUF1302 domain-containing protein [Pseudomonas triclosanedens]MCP8473361.1 DUF1302 domain-containing protein [Pseudomonas triclosanedens]MCP8479390.1 DUF1302 domain-containing protein [Pseudomonas triclosanedens]WAI47083.1 DUF1302 domain-containing protein [Pseudomonas triclosanedens]